jgi:hypothetical protein
MSQTKTTGRNKRRSNLIFVFSKKVKETEVHYTEIEREIEAEKIKNVLKRLPQGREKKIEEIELRTNPKKWIQSLIDGYPSDVDREKMANLISDFTENMMTRMREEEKYVIGMLSEGELILCHSVFGEETITPEWKIIPRMLDQDNVMRYVHFKKEVDSFRVKFYERYATDSFVEWLGLSQREALFHFGGKYRIYTEIGGINSVFELTENQIEQWIEEHPEMRTSKIKLKSPIEMLTITQIIVGKTKYNNPKDFLQDCYAEKYRINYSQEQFKEIIKTLEPYQYKFFDEKSQVIMIKGDDKVTKVEKRNPNFDILFSTENIECRESYLDDIFRRFINGERIRIFHAGEKFLPIPIEIKPMEIWNKIKLNELTQKIIEYYQTANLQDRVLTRLLGFVIFTILDAQNKPSYIHHFLEKFCKKFIVDIPPVSRVTKLEDKILEFKSRDYFSGKDEEIAMKICTDLKKKLQEAQYKIYLIGVEDDGTIGFIPDSRIKSDRLENIRQKIKQESQVTHLYLIPVKCGDNENILILIGGKGENGSGA